MLLVYFVLPANFGDLIPYNLRIAAVGIQVDNQITSFDRKTGQRGE